MGPAGPIVLWKSANGFAPVASDVLSPLEPRLEPAAEFGEDLAT